MDSRRKAYHLRVLRKSPAPLAFLPSWCSTRTVRLPRELSASCKQRESFANNRIRNCRRVGGVLTISEIADLDCYFTRRESLYCHQNTSPSATKTSRAGNMARGSRSHFQCSCLTLAVIANTNASRDANSPPISATAPRNPTQLSEIALDPPLAYATANIAPDNTTKTATAAAIPTAERAKRLLGCAALARMRF